MKGTKLKTWVGLLLAVSMMMSVFSFASAEIDTSKHVDLTMYLLGDAPADQELVYEELNKILNEKINVTLTTKYLSWGDYMTKYALILASGDDVDLIYTSDWAYYETESAKGAFYEITDEFMETYMPNMLAIQNPGSLEQAKINGKLFAIPKNNSGLEAESFVVIRKDLREKYGMDAIDSIEKLEAYFVAVTENEEGIYPFAANYDAGAFMGAAYRQPNAIYAVGPLSYSATEENVTTPPDFSELEYTPFREDIIPYYELMQKWANLGFWSKNAISNTESSTDAFKNGTSASFAQNPGTVFTAGAILRQNNPEWDFEILDVTPIATRNVASYSGDMMAIADASDNPERAAMLIDLIKSDLEVYMLLVAGIEGVHYVINEDGNRELGPQADKYPYDPSTWGFRWNDSMIPADASMDPAQIAFEASQKERFLAPITMAFRFDREPVKNEMAALEALFNEYFDMFQLGIVPDIRATLDEWKTKADAAGLPAIREELEKQYTAWVASLN